VSGKTTAHSIVEASPRAELMAGVIVALYALVTITPLLWIFLTSLKTPSDSIAYPPKIFSPLSLEGYCNLFTIRSRQDPQYMASLPLVAGYCERLARDCHMVIAGASKTPGGC
jgi:multiple sugar transport system permease protein